jgi:hypothetical protein
MESISNTFCAYGVPRAQLTWISQVNKMTGFSMIIISDKGDKDYGYVYIHYNLSYKTNEGTNVQVWTYHVAHQET